MSTTAMTARITMILRRFGLRRTGDVWFIGIEGDGSIGDSLPVSGTERGGFSSAMLIFL
jgi:hypothetical protein